MKIFNEFLNFLLEKKYIINKETKNNLKRIYI